MKGKISNGFVKILKGLYFWKVELGLILVAGAASYFISSTLIWRQWSLICSTFVILVILAFVWDKIIDVLRGDSYEGGPLGNLMNNKGARQTKTTSMFKFLVFVISILFLATALIGSIPVVLLMELGLVWETVIIAVWVLACCKTCRDFFNCPLYL